MNNFINALFKLYPQVTLIRGDDAFDVDGNPVIYDKAAVQLESEKMTNAQTAVGILNSTDWTTIADVASPTNNPYLANQSEFIAYRNVIRAIAVYPPAGEVVWPTPPTEVWLQGE
jgi:hypothetical protein